MVYEPQWLTTLKRAVKYPVQAFKQRKIKQIYAISKRKYGVMSKVILHYSEEGVRKDVGKVMRHAAVVLATTDRSNRRLLRASSLIAIPIAIPIYSQGWPSTIVWTTLLATGTIFAIGLILHITRHENDTWAFFTYAIAAMVSGVIAYNLSSYQFDKPWHTVLSGSGWPYVFFMVMALSLYMSVVAIPFIILVAQLTRRRILGRCPDYAATEELGLALMHLAMQGIKVGSLDNRNETIRHLENAAFLIVNGVPKKLGAPNALAQATLRGKCSSAASAIRELQTEVAFADIRALDGVRESIVNDIMAVCLGTYDIRPQGSLSQTPHLSLARKIGHASRTLLIGIIPLAVILSLRYGGIRLSPQFNNWAISVAILWAVIVFISSLDPLYTSRLRAVQDFISAFRGGTG
jgi:hypothetical protein